MPGIVAGGSGEGEEEAGVGGEGEQLEKAKVELGRYCGAFGRYGAKFGAAVGEKVNGIYLGQGLGVNYSFLI